MRSDSDTTMPPIEMIVPAVVGVSPFTSVRNTARKVFCSTSQAVNQLPGLGNIPILGALFRSREYQTQETELVILVTPYLVAASPLNAIAVPTDHTVPSSDAEAIFLGKMESMYGVGTSGAMRGSISGSAAYRDG